MSESVGSKVCTKCGVEKSFEEFNKEKSGRYGLRASCKLCDKVATEKRYGAPKSAVTEAAEEKICSKCGKVKRVEEFNKRTKTKDGLDPWCKACKKEVFNKYRVENLEKEAERYKIYKGEHKEEIYARRRGRQNDKETRDADLAVALKRHHERHATDSMYAFIRRARSVFGLWVRGITETSACEEWVSCSREELFFHLKTSGLPKDRCIDHICPICQANTEEEVIKLFHFSNLNITTPEENRKKWTSKTEEGEALCRSLLGREWID